MNIKTIVTLASTLVMAFYIATEPVLAQDTEDPTGLMEEMDLTEGNEGYEEGCSDQHRRDPNLTDKEFADSLVAYQESECAYTFEVGDVGFSGGYVIHVTDGGRHGIETSPEYISQVEWGCHGVNVPDATAMAIGTGQANTDAALDANCKSYYGGETAFPIVNDFEVNGFSDWYIPSQRELYKIFDVIGVLPMPDGTTLHHELFWSSSEVGDLGWKDKIKYRYSYSRNLVTGEKVYADKGLRLSVLPVRTF